MNIHGIGILFARGRGIAALEQALTDGWQPPRATEVPFQKEPFPLYSVAAETLADKVVLREVRRADRFSKMAVLAAWDAFHDGGIQTFDKVRIGVVLATAFGPHVTTFNFLDDILSFGDKGVSPTTFSHSVHNAAPSYAATVLDLRGPTLTLTQFGFPFHEALRLADTWLAEGRCDYVLVGVAEEIGAVMAWIAGQKLRIAPDGRIRPFIFARPPAAVPGEGSVFFLVSRADSAKAYGRIAKVSVDAGVIARPEADLRILDADGLLTDETGYREILSADTPAAAYAPLYGSLPTGSAFGCAAAALSISTQRMYATPSAESDPGIRLCRETIPASLQQVACVKRDCQGRTGTITLARQ